MILTILADRFNYQASIDELQYEWLVKILAFLEFDLPKLIEDGLDNPGVADLLFSKKIEIIDYPGLGAIEIKVNNETIGEWSGPKFTLKQDEKGGLYYEIEIECWSIMEENIEN